MMLQHMNMSMIGEGRQRGYRRRVAGRRDAAAANDAAAAADGMAAAHPIIMYQNGLSAE
jgi:hypothetical protein